MPKSPSAKLRILKKNGTLNPHPELVTDPLFQEEDFFDTRDLLQVKYEMLRRVFLEDWPVTRASETFGFSRPSFYKAQAAFEQEGLDGLIPKKRGPREAHKMSREVIAFVTKVLADNPGLSATMLALRVKEHFGLSVHPRSIERAMQRKEKKTS